jgi:ferric-dicitrate binding protein FerR (iron transport regulator)
MPSSLQESQKFVNQFTIREYTPEEHAAFMQWLKGASTAELAIIAERHESMEGEWVLGGGPSAAWVMQLEQKLNESVDSPAEEMGVGKAEPATVLEMEMHRSWRRRLWAAAAVFILILTGTYIYVRKTELKAGKIGEREKRLSMKMVNPRGGAQKEMILADGSKVWLNAGSELQYPPQFAGSERLVELSGEAFFDVAGSADRPFRVRIKDAEVEVLGTLFTIMAYEDEPENRTAVVDGDVKVTTDRESVIVKAGQEAEIVYTGDGAAGIPVVHSINAQGILARKKGIYNFHAIELRTIMREVARAYNATVQYQSNVGNPQIDGSLDLNKSLEVTLKRLEDATQSFQIHFKHNGNTIIIASTI